MSCPIGPRPVASLRPAYPSRRPASRLPWRHAVAARLDGPAMLGFVQARREDAVGPSWAPNQCCYRSHPAHPRPRRMRAPIFFPVASS